MGPDRGRRAGYLYRVRAERRRGQPLSGGSQLAAKRTLSPGEPAQDPFAAADLRDEVVRALRELPERQRAARCVLAELLD